MSTSFIALDECQSSTVKSSKNTTISSRSQKQQTTRETQNKSAIFLPKLPAKLFEKRIKETHFISGFYVEPTNQQLQDNALKNKLSVAFKGDLLKGSQIYLFMNSNHSDTIRRIKTADAPYRDWSKPCKSAIASNRVEKSSYTHSSVILSRSNSDYNFEKRKNFWSQKAVSSIDAGSNSTQRANKQLNDLKTELDRSQIDKEKFAQEWLEHSFSSLKFAETDIAIHALGRIWEFHRFALKNSTFFQEALESQSKLSEKEIREKVLISKKKANKSNSISDGKLQLMSHIFLDISDSFIDKTSFAVALKNLYHPDTIVIPGNIADRVLATAHFLKFENLKKQAVKEIFHSLSTRHVVNFYISSLKYQEEKAIEFCRNWLEMNIVAELSYSQYLKNLPLELLQKAIDSNRLFTFNEYSILVLILNWIFFQLNPDIKRLPTENVMIGYFTSLNKTNSLLEKYPKLEALLYSVRLHGLTNTNALELIEQMNLYPKEYLIKIIMDIQNSLANGGNMKFKATFNKLAIRQGFIIETDQCFYSETFSLYGFHFELIAEKISDSTFQFYIQRLSSNDFALTYEKIQSETISLKSERFCEYSINVQYRLREGEEDVFETTGVMRHTFGRTWSQTTKPFRLELKKPSNHTSNSAQIPLDISQGLGRRDNISVVEKLYVLFSIAYSMDD